MLIEWLQMLHDWHVATALRRSFHVYPVLNATHILALTLLIGTILPADLRMIGLFGDIAAAPFLKVMAALSAGGLALAVITGFFLFAVQPLNYAGNPAFLLKLTLVGLGIVNALAVRVGPAWRVAMRTGVMSRGLKAQAALSLAIWPAALLAGRWIAFV